MAKRNHEQTTTIGGLPHVQRTRQWQKRLRPVFVSELNGGIRLHELECTGSYWWRCIVESHPPYSCTPVEWIARGASCPWCKLTSDPLDTWHDLFATRYPVLLEWMDTTTTLDVDLAMLDMEDDTVDILWKCPKNSAHDRYQSTVKKVVNGRRCGYCYNNRMVHPQDSFQARFPDLAKDWAHDLNTPVTPDQVAPSSNTHYHMKCPLVVDMELDTRQHPPYRITLNNLTHPNQNNQVVPRCPACSGAGTGASAPSVEESLGMTHPFIVEEWVDSNTYSPFELRAHSTVEIQLRCVANQTHPYWWTTPNQRLQGAGAAQGKKCPTCRGAVVVPSESLAQKHPALAKEWHPRKNGDETADEISPRSSKRRWWICPKGHGEYQATPGARVRGTGCGSCNMSKMEACLALVLDTMGWEYEYNKPLACGKRRRPLRPDFTVRLPFGLGIGYIETDGQQHFGPVYYYDKGDATKFLAIVKRDRCKDAQVSSQGDSMLRIPFKTRRCPDMYTSILLEWVKAIQATGGPVHKCVQPELYATIDSQCEQLQSELCDSPGCSPGHDGLHGRCPGSSDPLAEMWHQAFAQQSS